MTRCSGRSGGVGLISVVLLLVLVGCGTSGTPTARASSPASSSVVSSSPTAVASFTSARCADLVVLGLRGQGQSTRADQGVGAEILDSVRATVARLTGLRRATSVRLEGVAYPNGPDATYDADVARGVRLTGQRLDDLARACPDSRFALVGYSQGAQVVHLAALGLTARQTRRVAAVAVLGDPLRSPSDPTTVVDYGTGPLAGRGNAGRGTAYPERLRARTLSFCVRGDDVCNAPLTGRVGPVSATHREFYESPAAVRVTSARLASVLASVLARSTAD